MSDNKAPRILLVDDEEAIQKLLAYPMEQEGYEIVQAMDGEAALEQFHSQPFDLIVLDIMLPGKSGIDVCREIRAGSTVPIIMLTAKSDEFDKVLGLEIGADDYITKPFSIREFRSRVKAQLRRMQMTQLPADVARETLEVDRLRIDFLKRNVYLSGEKVDLTYKEFELLKTLVGHPGRVFDRGSLLQLIWGDSDFRDPRTVDVHIRHLREKVEPDPHDPEYIFTVRGAGYKFRDI
ncbi:transcriptional regulatory protein YycF [bacterium BMS3Abin01]|nr:transcriptional regulatory protein YycF [bacterium BMS3Abin01]HDZ59870.1 response regulator transcription factor [Actinomycetota bacterium]